MSWIVAAITTTLSMTLPATTRTTPVGIALQRRSLMTRLTLMPATLLAAKLTATLLATGMLSRSSPLMTALAATMILLLYGYPLSFPFFFGRLLGPRIIVRR